jgi:hypothetical protein
MDDRNKINARIRSKQKLFEYSFNLNKEKINEMFLKYGIKNVSVPYKSTPMVVNNKKYVCIIFKIDENGDILGVNEYTVIVEIDKRIKR